MLYKKNITLYSLVGSDIAYAPHIFRINGKQKKLPSKKYTWTVNAFEMTATYRWHAADKTSNGIKYRALFKSFYRKLKVNGITKEYDGMRLRYTVVIPKSTRFYSKTATLRVGGKISYN